MSYVVDNAIIMAAGTASRFAPLSYEMPKALITVKGEVLIERQIRQLKEAGIDQIVIVVGYKKEQFEYLSHKFGVILVENNEYLTRNNNGSIYAARKYLKNSYVCSSDNYFKENPFQKEVSDSYYAAVYANAYTQEWCMEEDEQGYINQVQIGGEKHWYMLGHTFWSEDFSKTFLEILEECYNEPDTVNLLWESIFMRHLDVLKMKIARYPEDFIFEFDTLGELREFDTSYVDDTRSLIIKAIAEKMERSEREITDVFCLKDDSNEAVGFTFSCGGNQYQYNYSEKTVRRI